ncbi:hypothetical protein ACJ73_01500 [Blastomyces percursus]|uniref:Uncharacterized protein n=1 Tax=Blastomyces percursus TaxID=1658174 RepID=A0A1J9RGJ8_9EURO|nr:hypothetical protein ACJ73_01500 [Blastomyces percursus]
MKCVVPAASLSGGQARSGEGLGYWGKRTQSPLHHIGREEDEPSKPSQALQQKELWPWKVHGAEREA